MFDKSYAAAIWNMNGDLVAGPALAAHEHVIEFRLRDADQCGERSRCGGTERRVDALLVVWAVHMSIFKPGSDRIKQKRPKHEIKPTAIKLP